MYVENMKDRFHLCFPRFLRGSLHEPQLAANPGQDASPGQPFSSQTPVTVYMKPPGQTTGTRKQS